MPTSIVGNSDETAMLLLALAQDSGRSAVRKPDYGWVDQIREYRFHDGERGAAKRHRSPIPAPADVAVISGLTLNGSAVASRPIR